MFSLYTVMHRDSGKRYVGITCRAPEVRWSQHVSEAKNGSTTRFHRALNKYGREAFDWQLSSVFPNEHMAKVAEMTSIVFSEAEYNLTAGGDGTPGLTHTVEHRALNSAAKKGKPLSEEHRANISTGTKGLKKSPTACANIAAGRLGKTFPRQNKMTAVKLTARGSGKGIK